ncbi:MAG: hypothetical protein HYS07_10120 [Chlamydiae bacterium]|nr:hypothetical protein [Chlamydiota bacterium]MBI3276828.1 hypothetical protein [Chlamydiota bacterium]
MKKIFLIIIFIFPLLATGTIQEKFPEDFLGYIYFPVFSELIQQSQEYLVPFGQASQQAPGFLSTLFLKDTKIESFDLSRPMLYARLNPKKSPVPFFYTAYLKDKDLFLLGFGKSLLGGKGFTLKEETKNKPVQEYIEEQTHFDREGFLKALEKGPVDVTNFQTKVMLSYFLAFKDNQVIVSGSQELVQKFLSESLENILTSKKSDSCDLGPKPIDILLRSSQAYGVYREDLEGLRHKLEPALISKNLQSLQWMLETLEDSLGKVDELQLFSFLKADSIELEIDLKVKPDSSLAEKLKKSNQLMLSLKSAPLVNTAALLKVTLPQTLPISKFIPLGNKPEIQALAQNYASHIRNLFTFNNLSMEGLIKTILAFDLKEGELEKAHLDFNRLIKEVGSLQMTENIFQQVDRIASPSKILYSTFSDNHHWIGLKFDSPENFVSAVEKLKQASSASQVPLDEITADFPEKLNFFVLLKPLEGGYLAGYGKSEEEKFHAFFRIRAKEWITEKFKVQSSKFKDKKTPSTS